MAKPDPSLAIVLIMATDADMITNLNHRLVRMMTLMRSCRLFKMQSFVSSLFSSYFSPGGGDKCYLTSHDDDRSDNDDHDNDDDDDDEDDDDDDDDPPLWWWS